MQSLFRSFKKLSGMTGTAATEATEFSRIYDLSVVEVPTNRPVNRTDHSDVVFSRSNGEYLALAWAVSVPERNLSLLYDYISLTRDCQVC